MKTEREIITAYHECQLSSEENEIWDGESEMYINQGWQEALAWVIGALKLKRYTMQEEIKKMTSGRVNE
jgi:hypothetical protein